MKNKKIVFFLGVLVIVILLIFSTIRQISLEKHAILLKAKTFKWMDGAKGSVTLEYEFFYNGRKIRAGNGFGDDLTGNKLFEDQYFSVMYDPVLGASQLLIRPSDFKRFGLPFPDTLKWVVGMMKK